MTVLLKLRTNLYSAIKSEDSEALDGGTSHIAMKDTVVKGAVATKIWFLRRTIMVLWTIDIKNY